MAGASSDNGLICQRLVLSLYAAFQSVKCYEQTQPCERKEIFGSAAMTSLEDTTKRACLLCAEGMHDLLITG